MGDGPTDWDVIAPYGAVNGLDAEDMGILAKMCFGFWKAREEGANPLAIDPVDRE